MLPVSCAEFKYKPPKGEESVHAINLWPLPRPVISQCLRYVGLPLKVPEHEKAWRAETTHPSALREGIRSEKNESNLSEENLYLRLY